MKHILFAAALLLAVACGGGNKRTSADPAQGNVSAVTGVHDHSDCDHDHDHEGHDHADHEGHDHSAHNHTEAGHAHSHDGECDHDHESHNHAGHEGHDHSAHNHTEAGHAHSHDGECDHDHDGDDHKGHEGQEGHDHAAHSHARHNHGPSDGEHDDDPEDIIFTPSQAAEAGVEVRRAVRGTFREVIRVPGTISPAQGGQMSIVAPASGIVSFRSRLTEGTAVAGGTSLFSVSSGRISGGDEIAVNRAAYLKAKADYDRAVRLRGDNIVSQAELDALEAEYEAARAAYESLTDAGTGRGAAVTTPIGGYIYGIEVTEGDYVETGQLLATVAQERNMELRAEVPMRHYGRLPSVTAANFRTAASDEIFNTAELGGSLVSMGKGVQPGTPFVPVVFRFGYRPGILAGSYAEVSLLGAERANVMTLPLAAVTEQQGLYYVYVRTGADVYRRREVRLGGNDGRQVEILSGLADGEEVVVKGTVNIRMAAASGAIPHGHEH